MQIPYLQFIGRGDTEHCDFFNYFPIQYNVPCWLVSIEKKKIVTVFRTPIYGATTFAYNLCANVCRYMRQHNITKSNKKIFSGTNLCIVVAMPWSLPFLILIKYVNSAVVWVTYWKGSIFCLIFLLRVLGFYYLLLRFCARLFI